MTDKFQRYGEFFKDLPPEFGELKIDAKLTVEPMTRLLQRIDADMALLVSAGLDPTRLSYAHINEIGHGPMMGVMVDGVVIRRYGYEFKVPDGAAFNKTL